MEKRMKNLLIILLGVILSSCAFGETNYFEAMNKLPRDERKEYILSLNETAVLSLANEAYQSGWDNYAVNAGILAKYYGSKQREFTATRKLAILKDRKMHPAFRANIASQGLRVNSFSDLNEFLNYVDEVFRFFEDPTVRYFWKQGIPEWVQEALHRKAEYIQKQSKDNGYKAEALDKIHTRGIRMMSDLMSYLEKNPRPSKDSEGCSASSLVAASLSKYVAWYLNKESSRAREAEKYLDAVRKARRALIRVLEDGEYASSVAGVVLHFAEDSKLDQVLTQDSVMRFRKDKRFAGDECRQLLDRLEERIKEK